MEKNKQELKDQEYLLQAAVLEGHTDRVWCVAWAPSGDLLASCSGDKTIRLWSKDKDHWTSKVIEGAHERTIRRVEFSPDGKYLAAASFDATCSIWEEDNGKFRQIAALEGHENEVKSVAFDAAGSLIATCSRDKSVWIWAMDSDKEFECVSVCTGHTQDVKTVVWHPTQEMLVSASYDDTIKVWQTFDDDWYCSQTLSGHTSTVWDVTFDSTGNHLASVSDDRTVIIWEYKQVSGTNEGMELEGKPNQTFVWEKIQTIPPAVHQRTIYSVDWSTNNVLVTGAADNAIRLFVPDSVTNQFKLRLVKERAHGTFDLNTVAWNPKYPNVLATGADDYNIKIWSFEYDSWSAW